MKGLHVDELLINCIINGTREGMQMTGVEPSAVGVSRYNATSKDLTVLVGLHGRVNGQISLHLSQNTACFLAGKMLEEEDRPFDEDTLDAVCEIGNMVAGRFRTHLESSEYAFTSISLPAVVFGANYNVYHFRNINTATVTFEIREMSIMRPNDRLFSAGIVILESA